MNNKGFAISSLLYGLLIVGFLVITLLMSSMATNRSNTKILIEKIEEELGRIGRTSAEFDSSQNPQQFIVPYNKAGWYKIELWHKKDSESKYRYLSAVVELKENQHLNFEAKDEYTRVTATSKGKSKLLLEADDSYISTDITGDGVIDDGTIQVKKVLNIPASTNITTKAKIQLLGTNTLPGTDFEAGYSYYIKDSDDNFMGLNSNPIGTKYDDAKSLKWLIEQNVDDVPPTYKIINTSNNQALYDDNSGSLKMAEFNPNNEQQKWIIPSTGSNKYKIQNKATNKFLSIDTSSAGTVYSVEEIYLIKADY